MRLRLALLPLLISTAASADPVVTTSYRAQTMTADGIGLGLLIGGGLAEAEGGRDTTASETLFALGGLTVMFATPVIHFARGHRERAVSSFLMRGGLAGAGMLFAMSANSDCDAFLCQLDYVGYGMLGGLVVATAIDAAFMTDEIEQAPRWTPRLTASRDGVRAGVAWAW